MSLPKIRLELYKPHAAQRQMHESTARFRIATCGRRFGKTYMAVNEVMRHAYVYPFSSIIWVAPTYRQSRLAYTIMINNFHKAALSYTKNPMEIHWSNGSITKFLSTESGDTLRGDSAHLIVVDEAAMIEDEVWDNILRPMLSDTNGKAIIISTPRGLNNWFHRLYQRGKDPAYQDYESFKFPSSSNPHIMPTEIDEVRHTLPADVFKQEYLAEFLEDGGIVFKNVELCVAGELEEYQQGHQYVCAWDIAKHSDFSCIVVMDVDQQHVVYFDRFNRVDYALQIERVNKITTQYHAALIIDSTGVGDPILEQLKIKGLDVEGFQFTNNSKQQLIEHLAVLVEKREITFPRLDVLIHEMQSFQYELTRAGNIRYNAPTGLHDDSVIALALAAWKVRHQKSPRLLIL